jgi:hypothetical protein
MLLTGVQRCDNWWVRTDSRAWECLLRCSWEFLDHLGALVSCPVISISLGLLEKYLASRQFSVDGDGKAGVTCQLQTHDTSFFYNMIQALVLWEDKSLYVNGEYMEVWCVPSATHVTYIHQSQNQVLGMRVFLTLFLASSLQFLLNNVG